MTTADSVNYLTQIVYGLRSGIDTNDLFDAYVYAQCIHNVFYKRHKRSKDPGEIEVSTKAQEICNKLVEIAECWRNPENPKKLVGELVRLVETINQWI